MVPRSINAIVAAHVQRPSRLLIRNPGSVVPPKIARFDVRVGAWTDHRAGCHDDDVADLAFGRRDLVTRC
ncbi:hypothetical protein A5691_19420 [Mycobacterium sp. E183]|nr:hypothetical protein A5691_19420 [Mycobacterium sp. E183]